MAFTKRQSKSLSEYLTGYSAARDGLKLNPKASGNYKAGFEHGAKQPTVSIRRIMSDSKALKIRQSANLRYYNGEKWVLARHLSYCRDKNEVSLW